VTQKKGNIFETIFTILMIYANCLL